MIPFATEFQVDKDLGREQFISSVLDWIGGIRNSKVLKNFSLSELDGDSLTLENSSGERLSFLEVRVSDSHAIGFRHDIPDADGRLWRTEVVLKSSDHIDQIKIIRCKTQCIALEPGAKIDLPKKPVFLKTLISDGFGSSDGEFSVGDQPIALSDRNNDLQIATQIVSGTASLFLPVIYVSAVGDKSWLASPSLLRDLAYELGGVAHIVLEPSRSFSFGLRDLSEARNVYGGALGLFLPKKGLVGRYLPGLKFHSVDEILVALKAETIRCRSQMPASGLDWAELQEASFHATRAKNRGKLSISEIEQLYDSEINRLKERIAELEVIERASEGPRTSSVEENSIDDLLKAGGHEVYAGEFFDKIRFAARQALEQADLRGYDARTTAVLNILAERIPASVARSELLSDIERACKDKSKVARDLVRVLKNHGYQEKADNKHIRMEARNDYVGLDSITIPKTPSDNRGLKNLQKQIEGTLGLKFN